MKKYNEEEIHDAIKLVGGSNINRELKRILFDTLLWKFTEIKGKYNDSLPWSEKALEKRKTLKKKEYPKYFQHEHTTSKKNLKNRLVEAKNPEELREIMKDAKTCIITKEEHKKIDHKIQGKGKYDESDIMINEDK